MMFVERRQFRARALKRNESQKVINFLLQRKKFSGKISNFSSESIDFYSFDEEFLKQKKNYLEKFCPFEQSGI
jgi:hypothetical protein